MSTIEKPAPRTDHEVDAPDVAAVRDSLAHREVIPFDPRYSTRWHRHDYPSPIARWNHHPEYEVHLITASVGRYIVGEAIGTFAPGQLVLVGPDVPHDWMSDLEPGEVVTGRDVVLQFHDDWIRACQGLLPELADLEVLLRSSRRGIEFLGGTARRGAELLMEIGKSTGTARLVATFALLEAMATAPEDEVRLLADPWIPTLRDPQDEILVSRTLRYIFDNITGDVRLGTAARMIGMSDSAFSRFFTAASGLTFSDTVKRLRLAHACRLLESGSRPVSEISHEVGYRNLSNFNRQFREQMGCTPTEHRRRMRGGAAPSSTAGDAR